MRDNHRKMPRRRDFIRILGAGAVAAGTSLGARAQDVYPSRPITLIVPWTAGGGSDGAMRVFAQIATKYLKQTVVIENIAGASGTLGPARMARTAKPDGYTLSQIPAGIFRLPAMHKTDWDPQKDFDYIARIAGYQGIFVVRADSPIKTLNDLITFAKAHPGEVTYGSVGVGTGNHLNVAEFGLKAGLELTHVPYKGSSESLTALLGGHVMLVSSESAGSYIVSGKVRALAVTNEKRLSRFPDIPTLHELGYGGALNSSYGWAGPAGMDPKIVAYLDGITKKVTEDPEFIEAMVKFDQVIAYLNTADYNASISRELAAGRRLIEALGLVEK